MALHGGFIKTPRKKEKSRLYKVLESDDLLFNFIVAVWLLGLALVFGQTLKIFLPLKMGMTAFYFLIAIFLINLFSKSYDILTAYLETPITERVIREVMRQRKLKQKTLKTRQN